ncbi:MAG TPA: [protein-PII] uridylyltransferase, partial [Hellea balneolensis]|nr:[protein-PII] uridylyltransferase [Hellea balneolensis]
GEMAPFSDLDLLFLCTPKSDKAKCAKVTEYILYLLWDMGLKVGYATRSPAQCLEIARDDETVLTALLDLRYLAGAKDPAARVVALLAKERTRAKKRRYIAAKLAARDRRHDQEGNSRYVIEPNVKEGKGGLRDLHELYWIARFVYGGKRKGAPLTPHGVASYMKLGLLNKRAAERFEQAAEFLWAVRIHLHLLSGRAVEILSFDKQAELARRMGYTQEAPEKRVESFMHSYFNTTREVGALTRMACAKLEADSELLLPQGLDRFLPTVRRGLKEPGFVLDHGRLNFSQPGRVKKQKLLMLNLFRIAGARNLDIHPNAYQTVLNTISGIDDRFRKDGQAFSIFKKILLDSEAPGAILRLMNETGLLGAYLPEFGGIVGRTQFNMHHAYTVDEHTITLVSFLNDLERGELEREHPLASGFITEWDRRTRMLVYLACLFHDVGKAEGDQCADGARLATQACLRLGLSHADTETISWLVRTHLLMSETAQRRDISDPETIKTFARAVGSLKRLQMLTALTVVDIRAVGPGIWNDWKGELLRQLYYSARTSLMGMELETRPQSFGDESAYERAREKAKRKTHYVKAKLNRNNDITELWVLTRDRPHLFADLAGAIASAGASIVSAKLHTAEDGRVFNRFYVQNPEGRAFGRLNKNRLKDLEARTLAAARGEFSGDIPQTNLISRRARAIPVHPRISIERQTGPDMMIEITARDRPGLLYGLASVLADHDLSVRSAHIEVLGPKAIDVFYCSYEGESELREQSLRSALLGVMEMSAQGAA